MKTTPSLSLILITLTLVFSAAQAAVTAVQAMFRTNRPASTTAAFQATTENTILFKTQNGQGTADNPDVEKNIPHLVLFRNGEPTDHQERTLGVKVTGIPVPAHGMTVTLQIETQHGSPDVGEDEGKRILVWEELQWLPGSNGANQAAFTIVFEQDIFSGTQVIPTPTDYFRVRVLTANSDKTSKVLIDQDYAFMMESQWVVPLPEVLETAKGAAPDTLVIYYCDMFPFRLTAHNPDTWLPRNAVPQFIGEELAPAMAAAFDLQTNTWNFPWYPEWTPYREGQERSQLSVALSDGETWFHGQAPSRGLSGITINVNAGDNGDYENLLDGLLGAFHHELFHNLQRNIQQHFGGSGDVDGPHNTWAMLSEGAAVMAVSVAQPEIEFEKNLWPRTFLHKANSYLGDAGPDNLNRSYQEMWPYYAALYWRFLFEQCGGLGSPQQGMAVFRTLFHTLYHPEYAALYQSSDLVQNLPQLIDAVLAKTPGCPFQTHAGSLVAFAGSIYALQLDGGRCRTARMIQNCGFYDPAEVYASPKIDTISYDGTVHVHDAAIQRYPAGVKSSFGIDFVDVVFAPEVNGQPVVIEFTSTNTGAVFELQAWEVVDPSDGSLPLQVENTGTLVETGDGRFIYTVPLIDVAECSRVGLAIVRVDSNESQDPVGGYIIRVHP